MFRLNAPQRHTQMKGTVLKYCRSDAYVAVASPLKRFALRLPFGLLRIRRIDAAYCRPFRHLRAPVRS